MKNYFKKMVKLVGVLLVGAFTFMACTGNPEEVNNEFAGKTFYHQEDVSSFGVADIKEITVGQITFNADGKGNITEYGIEGVEGDSFDFTYTVEAGVATLKTDGISFSTSQIKDDAFTLNGLKYTSKKLASYKDLEKKLNIEEVESDEVKFPKVDFTKLYLWNSSTAGNTFNASTGVLTLSGIWSGASGGLYCDAKDYNCLKIEYEQLRGSVQFFVVYNDENVETDSQSKSIVSLKASENVGYIELNSSKKNNIAHYHLMADSEAAVSIKIKNIEFVKKTDLNSETKEETGNNKEPEIITTDDFTGKTYYENQYLSFGENSEIALTTVSEMTFGSNGQGNYKEYLTTGVGETKSFTYVVFDGIVTITMDGNKYTSTKVTDGEFSLNITMSTRVRKFSTTKYRTFTEAWNEYEEGIKTGVKQTFSITLDGNGADDFVTDTFTVETTGVYGSFTFTKNPTKEGYIFVGWKDPNRIYPNKYYFAGDKDDNVCGNTTYKAFFMKKELTITFDANTTKGGQNDAIKITLKYDEATRLYEKLTFPECNFTNDDCEFLGWCIFYSPSQSYFDDYSYQPGASIREYSDYTYYAVWKPKYYWVTFDANGNGVTYLKRFENTAALRESLVVKDLFLNQPQDVKYKYYIFNGWSNSVLAKTVYKESEEYELNGPKTFYANWKLGTIINDENEKTLNSSSYTDEKFTLIKSSDIQLKVTASDAINVYIIDADGSKVISEKSTNVEKTKYLYAGTYTLRIENNHILYSKKYKRMLKGL